jgi:hypothetical protein
VADGFVQVAPDSTGKMLDTESLTVGVNTVHRQREQVVGAAAAEIARVMNTAPASTDYGLVTRLASSALATNRTATGTITALNGAVEIDTNGAGGVGVAITGTWVATLQFQVSVDNGATWIATLAKNLTTLFLVGSTTANGTFDIDSGGKLKVRVTATAFASGTATISFTGSPVPNMPIVMALGSGVNNSLNVAGNVANGVTDSGNSIKTGGKASSGAPTAVTAGQRVDAYYDLRGRQVVSVQPNRVPSFVGTVGTFRAPGRAAATQNLFALHNATGSAILVAVRRIMVESGQTTASLVMPVTIMLSRITTIPSNGTSLSKVGTDTAQSSSVSVTAWGDASADGTSSGTTLAATAGNRMAVRLTDQLYTAVGWALTAPDALLDYDNEPIVLRALEGILVSISTPTAAENIAGRSFVVSCDFEEYTL